ncbi:PLDc N-terminal domain-containing protein [Metapseudomonas otitidis]|uniref:PLDc N-terminal domain-containing protein n=1 Tax=Metapseudomonas otitidis TaxID=319939 RepID=UPI0032174A1D
MSGATIAFYGGLGALYLLLTAWALYNVVTSNVPRQLRWLWVALLVLFPVLGLFNWAWMGPRRRRPGAA